MADTINKSFLNLEGLTTYHQKISAKIDDVSFSGNYEDLNNKPTIQKMLIDETTETLIIL